MMFADERKVFDSPSAQTLFFLDGCGDNVLNARALAAANFVHAVTDSEAERWKDVMELLDMKLCGNGGLEC